MPSTNERLDQKIPPTISLLVVEDNVPYRYLIGQAFRARQEILWHITVAENGEQALKILFDEEKDGAPLPDLILLDWNLPKISGQEVLHRIKQHDQLRKIPVLIFSSSDAEEDIHSAYHGHANGFITKPGDIDLLAAMVETIELFWISVARLPKVLRNSDRDLKPAAT